MLKNAKESVIVFCICSKDPQGDAHACTQTWAVAGISPCGRPGARRSHRPLLSMQQHTLQGGHRGKFSTRLFILLILSLFLSFFLSETFFFWFHYYGKSTINVTTCGPLLNQTVNRRDLEMCCMGWINQAALVVSPCLYRCGSGVVTTIPPVTIPLLWLLAVEAPEVSRFILALATSPLTSRKMRNVSRDLWPRTDQLPPCPPCLVWSGLAWSGPL